MYSSAIQALLSPLLSHVVPVQGCAFITKKDWSTEVTAKISALPSLFNLTPKQKVFILPAQTLPLYHTAGERRRRVSLKPGKNACNTSWACCPLCPRVPSLAWAQPGARSKSDGRSCLHPAPRGHISCWCSVQRQEHPEATRLQGLIPTPHSTQRVTGCEEGFSPLLLHLLHSFPLYGRF